MALIARGMYKLILRVNVEQEISQEGWRFVISEVLPNHWGNEKLGAPTFDGEILCIQAMSPMDMSFVSEKLMSFGFRWSEDLDGADFAWFEFNVPNLDWLEEVSATPLRRGLREVVLWQLRGSRLDYFADDEGRVWWRDNDYSWG